MLTVIYHSPTGKTQVLPDVGSLHDFFLSPSADHWMQGSGDAKLEVDYEGQKSDLIIMPHERHGFYLQYTDKSGTWLSLHDRRRLDDVTKCLNEWQASIGLFLAPAEAWVAVVHFCETGQRSPQVEWIAPIDMPETGNY